MKILKEFDNNPLNRKEITCLLESEKTPSYMESLKIISNEMKSSEDCIVIESIKGKFGSKNFTIKAKIYKSKEDKEKIEQKKKEKKEGGSASK